MPAQDQRRTGRRRRGRLGRRLLVPALAGVLVVLGSPGRLLVDRPATGVTARTGALVALGDSVPAGTACGCRPYPAQAAGALGPEVTARDLARDGQTSRGLLVQLDEPGTREVLRHAAAVTVTVGANDFDESRVGDPRCAAPSACFSVDLEALSGTLLQVLGAVRALAPTRAPVVVTGYWNVFRDGAVGADHGPAYVRGSDALTREVNARIAAAAAAAGVRYVDVYSAFESTGDVDALLADDGDHPDAQGHRLIADLLAPALALPPVPPSTWPASTAR